MIRTAVLLACVLIQTPSPAPVDPGVVRDGDYVRLYQLPEDQVFRASARVAADYWTLTSTNPKAGVVSFSTSELYVTVRVGRHKTGKARVRVDAQMRAPGMFSLGRGKKIAGLFFDRLEARLRAEDLLPPGPERAARGAANGGWRPGEWLRVSSIMDGPTT